MPVRVSLDAPALALGADELCDALDAALDRALGASQRAVLAPRGGYQEIVARTPDFTWSGAAAGGVDAAGRLALEELVSERIGLACTRAGLSESFRRPTGLAAPLGDAPFETFDPLRYDATLAFYDLPTYGGGGARRPAPVRPKRADDAPQVVRHAWIAGPRFGKYGNEWYAHVTQLYTEALRQFPDRPSGEFTGLIQEVHGGDFEVYFEDASRTHYYNFKFTPQPMRRLDANGQFREVGIRTAPVAIAHLQRVTAVGPSRDDRIAALSAIEGPIVRAELRKAATRSTLVSDAEFEAALDARVETEMRVRERTLAPGTVALATLTIGGFVIVLSLPAGSQYDWRGTAVLLPVAAVIRRTDLKDDSKDSEGGDGDGQGTGPGRGTGRPGGTGAEGGAEGAEGSGRTALIDLGAQSASQAAKGALFPSVPWGDASTDVCEPFIDEPSLETLGEAAANLRAAVLEIAAALDIEPCMYGGHFALHAAAAINLRASTVAEFSAGLANTAVHHGSLGDWSAIAGRFLEPLQENVQGNLGTVHFRPVASPALQYMRHVARVVPLLARFSLDLYRLYERYPGAISGAYHGNAGGWSFHFLYRFNTTMVQSVGLLFGQTCRVLFLQLLWSSRDAIVAHQNNQQAYVETFRQVIVPQLQHVDALMALKNRLAMQIDAEEHPFDFDGNYQAPPEPAPEMVADERGWTNGIRDGNGHVWNVERLESAISLRRGVVEDIDPIVKQFTDLPEVMTRIGPDGSGTAEVIRDTLASMLDHNAEQIQETLDSWLYAFKVGKISKGLPNERTGGIEYDLQGIHLQAHQQIAEFFENAFYADGVNALFSGIEAWASFTSFLEFTGIVLLAVVCPPLGTAAGIAAAAYHLHEAKKRESLWFALLDPDQLISFAEVEAEVFAAKLGLALAFIPDAVTIVRGGLVGVRVAAEEGVLAGTRAGLRAIPAILRDEAMQAMQQALEKGLLQTFVTECAKAELINALLQRALAPAIDDLVAEIDRTGPVGGLSGAQQVFARLSARRGTR